MQVARLSTVKNYTTISLIDGTKYAVRISLVNALNNFLPGMFVKIDRGEVVSVFYIDNITKHLLIMNGKTVTIAMSYHKYAVSGINIIDEQ